jgi:hypothetical protein
MSTPNDFRRYADECLQSAENARDDFTRKRFLDLAKLWMTAARQRDDGMSAPLVPKDVHNDNHQ